MNNRFANSLIQVPLRRGLSCAQDVLYDAAFELMALLGGRDD